jgi:mono/diheme cytochrome c family protein
MFFYIKNKIFFVTVALLLAMRFISAQDNGASAATHSGVGRNDMRVTPVAGESWLKHLHRAFDETSMGKTWHLGPPPVTGPMIGKETSAHPSEITLAATHTRSVYGSDLYRFNCRACHGDSGAGAPPEIGSLIDPVKSTSVALIRKRMKKSALDISPAEAEQLAQQSEAALLERLHSGGQDMPPFPQLGEAEISSLITYLKQLAGLPGTARKRIAVEESQFRIGEHIVKSTCHICHSAAGPNPSPEQLLEGYIPPLETLTRRTTQVEFVRKVTRGAPIMMGTPALLCRGRMPVFYYLTEEEVADAYLYLTFYPPYQWAVPDSATSVIARDLPQNVPRNVSQKKNHNRNDKNRRAQARPLGAASSVVVNR